MDESTNRIRCSAKGLITFAPLTINIYERMKQHINADYKKTAKTKKRDKA